MSLLVFRQYSLTHVLIHSPGFASSFGGEEHVEGVVDGDDSFEDALLVDDGDGQQVVLCHDLGNGTGLGVGLHGDEICLHQAL